MKLRSSLLLLCGLVISAQSACSSESSNPADTVAADSVTPDTAPGDTAADDTDSPAPDGIADTAADAPQDVAADIVPLPVAFPSDQRGWITNRGLIHLHSAYSHDGCSPDGYEDNNGPDPECLKQLRDAACAHEINFLFMTDHPGQARNHSFEELSQFHADKGDEMMLDQMMRPFANKLKCPEGSPQEFLYVFVGTEGHKNMPIGVAGPIPETIFSTDYGIEGELQPALEAVSQAHDLGGLAMAVHTEQDNIPAERIIALDLDGMEIYNLHANLMDMLKGSLETLYAMDHFMGETNNDPPSDLALLLFLAPLDVSVQKVDTIAAVKHLTTFLATDIHRNVEFPQLCTAGPEKGMCAAIFPQAPKFAGLLATGGPVQLKDGERMDSYNRAMRWFSNRILVKDDSPDSVRQALRDGRAYGAFDTLGNPVGFDFVLWTGTEVVEIGGEVPFADGMTLYVNLPKVGPAPWDLNRQLEFEKAYLTTKLVKMTPEGSSVVAEAAGLANGGTLSATVDGAAAYRVEIWIKPKHLKPILGALADKADESYPYIYSSPIFVR